MGVYTSSSGHRRQEASSSCVDSDNPAKYPPISARAHLMSKHLASMGAADASSENIDAANDEL
jgi:hypothetical protein